MTRLIKTTFAFTALTAAIGFATPAMACDTCEKHAKDHKHDAEHAHEHVAAAARMDIVDTAVSAKKFTTLVAAVKAAGLVETLKGDGPFTVFAPTDDAFAKLPEGTVKSLLKPENKDKLIAILTYHVVPGKVMAEDVVGLKKATTVQGQSASITVSDKGVRIDDAHVVKTDIETSNGVIHIIDSVIMPKDIVGIAASTSDFTTLVAAVKAAGLVETLQGPGPYTVFAPTNEAFAKLPEGTVESLLKPENKKKLIAILKYHIVPGNVKAADVVKLTEAKTANGQSALIEVKKWQEKTVVKVAGAKVIKADIPALNGTVHVIDSVMLPE